MDQGILATYLRDVFARGGTLAALALAVAWLVVLPPESAQAAGPCDPTDPHVYRWVGGQADHDWMQPLNWRHGPANSPGAPNDDVNNDGWHPGVGGDTSSTVACIDIPTGHSDFAQLIDSKISAFVWVQELHVTGDFTVAMQPHNTGLLVMDQRPDHTSTLGPEVLIDAQGTFGGWATIESEGVVELKSNPGFPAHLSSEHITGDTYTGPHGKLVVEPGGQLLFSQSGMALSYSYSVELHGLARLSGLGSYLGAGWGTSFDIEPTGRFEIANDGGYYQGFQAGQPTVSQLRNAGVLVKTGGDGISVIDAGYAETGLGRIEVLSGTVAFPGGTSYQARVARTKTLSTNRCVLTPGLPLIPRDCAVTVDPAQDPESVALTVPAGDGDGALVTVHEDAAAATTIDGNGVGPVFTAHADDLDATAADPAVIVFRMGVPIAGSNNPDLLSIVHVSDLGVQETLPRCLPSGQPPSGTGCVERLGSATSSHGDGQNVYLVVRTTTTSRYICRKETKDVIAPMVLTAASASRSKLGRPIRLSTTLSEAATLTVTGRIKTKGVRVPGLRLKTTAQGQATVATALSLTLKKKLRKRLGASGATKGSIRLTIKAQDAAGNAAPTQKLTVKLR